MNCMHDQQIVLYEMQHPIDVIRCNVGVSPTLQNRMGTGGNNVPLVVENSTGDGISPTLDSHYYKGPSPLAGTEREVIAETAKPPRKYIVRRLTPLECCRLQGFPDWWEDGVEGSDSARYKMWGNGIALPCAVDVMGRIAKAERTKFLDDFFNDDNEDIGKEVYAIDSHPMDSRFNLIGGGLSNGDQ